jgi:hypothetical protein
VTDSAREGGTATPEDIREADARPHRNSATAGREYPPDGRARTEGRPTTHLYSAARTLEQILGELYPEHDWVVTVGEVERPDRQRNTATPVALEKTGTVGDHAGAIVDGHPPAAADRHDDHGLDQAA